jgi:hypothetical protein
MLLVNVLKYKDATIAVDGHLKQLGSQRPPAAKSFATPDSLA